VPREGDALIVTRLDRLARSARGLLNILRRHHQGRRRLSRALRAKAAAPCCLAILMASRNESSALCCWLTAERANSSPCCRYGSASRFIAPLCAERLIATPDPRLSIAARKAHTPLRPAGYVPTADSPYGPQKSGVLAFGTAASLPAEKNPNLFSAQTFSTHAPGRVP
jgi:hypothetical protein